MKNGEFQMEEKKDKETYQQIFDAVRQISGIIEVHTSGCGDITFQREISLKDAGVIHSRYTLSVYSDIHKAELLIIPSPVIREEHCTAVMKWFLRRRNRKYRTGYGISMAYETYRKQLALRGIIHFRENPEKDVFRLLTALERCLAEDFPQLLDIYFGVIPDGIRLQLSKEVRDYQAELGAGRH